MICLGSPRLILPEVFGIENFIHSAYIAPTQQSSRQIIEIRSMRQIPTFSVVCLWNKRENQNFPSLARLPRLAAAASLNNARSPLHLSHN
jgi:hypothetical protein